jgi:hypothetical protein
MSMKLLDGFAPIGGFRDQIHIRLSCNEARDTLECITQGLARDPVDLVTHDRVL